MSLVCRCWVRKDLRKFTNKFTRGFWRLCAIAASLAAITAAHAQSIMVVWNPVNSTDVGNYTLFYGTSSGNYVFSDDVGTATNAILTGLQTGTTYYFSVRTYDSLGVGSAFSPEVVYTTPLIWTTNPVVTWTNPAPITYGVPLSAVQFNASANVPGTFAYSPPVGTILPAGNGQVITSVFTPQDIFSYNIITNSVTIDVGQRLLTITPQSSSIVYGTTLPALTLNYSGFVNGDSPANLTTQPTVTTTATQASGVGNYPITVSGATNPNYAITFNSGTLAITPANLSVSVSNAVISQGSPVPSFSPVYTGFVNGDTGATLTTPATVTTSASSGSQVGTYTLVASGAASSNYNISFSNGTLTVIAALGPTNITNGLVLWYRFDDGSGSSALDSSGDGYTGVLQNASQLVWGTGVLGGDLIFSGSGNHVASPAFPLANTFSVSCWVNAATRNSAYARIVESAYNSQYYLGFDATGTKLQWIVNSSVPPFGNITSPAINPGTWYFVTGTYDGATASLYVNGSLVSANALPAPSAQSLQVYIGSYRLPGWDFNGAMDDVRVYNRALSPSEVTNLFQWNASTPSNPFSAVAGVYNALFYPTNTNGTPAITETNSGFLGNCVVSTNGSFSARFFINGSSTALSGAFTTAGVAVISVPPVGGLSNLTAILQLDMSNGTQQIFGTVYSLNIADIWSAPLSGWMASNSMSIPGGATLTLTPQPAANAPVTAGSISCLVTNGMLTMVGTLPDSAVFSQTVPLSGNGSAPIYASLYNNAGLIEGWITISNATAVSGNLFWFRPPGALPAGFPLGFNDIVQVSATSNVTNGLALWYRFDDGSGTLAADSSGNGYTGTLLNPSALSWMAGGIEGDLAFNGGSVISPSFSLGNTFTVSCWVNASSGNVPYARIVESGYNTQYYLGLDPTGTRFQWIVNNGVPPFGNVTGPLVPGAWCFVTATFSGTTGTLYLNGTNVSSATFAAPATQTLPVRVGAYSLPGWNFKGALDDVRVYNRALSPSEISTLYRWSGP